MTSDLHHLAAAYTLDALAAEERETFERHLADCELCRDEVADFRATAAVLGEAVAATPPPGLRDAVLAEVGATRQDSPIAVPGAPPTDELAARRTRRLVPLMAVAAAVILVAVGVIAVLARGGSDRYDDVVAAPDAVATSLAGDGSTVDVVWSPGRGEVAVSATSLAATADGFTYELWAIAGGTPVPAGLFEPDRYGGVRAVTEVGELTELEAWGITIEPDGGSEAPTGEILFFAETS